MLCLVTNSLKGCTQVLRVNQLHQGQVLRGCSLGAIVKAGCWRSTISRRCSRLMDRSSPRRKPAQSRLHRCWRICWWSRATRDSSALWCLSWFPSKTLAAPSFKGFFCVWIWPGWTLCRPASWATVSSPPNRFQDHFGLECLCFLRSFEYTTPPSQQQAQLFWSGILT